MGGDAAENIDKNTDVPYEHIDSNSKVSCVLAQRTGGEGFDPVRDVTELSGAEALEAPEQVVGRKDHWTPRGAMPMLEHWKMDVPRFRV